MNDESNDLNILFPNKQITAGGKTLTVREYSFKESLNLHELLQPLIEAIGAMIEGDAMPRMEQVISLLAGKRQALIELMAISADCEQAFIENLSQQEGQRLLLLWWAVNGPFLIGSAVEFAQMAAIQQAHLKQSAGAQSLPA